APPLVLFMLDPDAPTPDNPNRITILHALQSSLVPSEENPLQLTANAPPVTPYRGPGPPAGSAPHRYIFLFYEEPLDFQLPEGFNATQRAGFDLASFVAATRLGDPVGAVFF
ncbi:PEBP-like protein, partial [Ascobolus immersus RN42]